MSAPLWSDKIRDDALAWIWGAREDEGWANIGCPRSERLAEQLADYLASAIDEIDRLKNQTER